MKKTILIIAIAFLGFAATAQEFIVTDQKPIDYTAKDRIQMSFEKITRMQRDFYIQMKKEDVLQDSISYKGKIDALFSNMWTVHGMFENEMSMTDTITLYKIDGKFYESMDTTKVDLITERQQIIARYNSLVAKYGELAVYEREFQTMKKRFEQIGNWEKQITE